MKSTCLAERKIRVFSLLRALWKTFISDTGQAMSALQGPVLGRLQTHVHSSMREHAEMPCAVGVVLWGTSLRRELPTCQKKRYDFFLSQEIKGTVVRQGDPSPQ